MLHNISRSLTDLLGNDYSSALAACAAVIQGMDAGQAHALLHQPVDFFSSRRSSYLDDLLPMTGTQITAGICVTNSGAGTMSYNKASHLEAAPLSGIGPFRVGEDGRLYLAAKSEHYHISLGHGFEGYRLITLARQIGILNATHNNTRGYITRLMEKELIRTISGLPKENGGQLDSILAAEEPKVLNRVINLETGSLAVEAGVKMMLARFYSIDPQQKAGKYQGKIPVFFVMGDNEGGNEANYHGTTMMTQMMRGLWPCLYDGADGASLFKVVGVRINDIKDFAEKMTFYNSGDFKTAGFLHEIILMNYGGIRLTREYLQAAYKLCADTDTPALVDEIQSCMWYRGMYLFKLYDLKPDFVVLGKGFPGGEYPASKIITTYEMDNLTQFGALVTNGQEELASLSYLITMEFASSNAGAIEEAGDMWQTMLEGLMERHPEQITRIEGLGLLSCLHFSAMEQAREFSARLNRKGIDISAQTYKANCPPAVLAKLPLISSEKLMQYLCDQMEEALQ